MGCGGSSAGDLQRKAQKEQEAKTLESMANIHSAFAGFNPAFYNKAQQSYMNYALPQLAQQNRDMTRQMTYGLAGQGLLNSGAANTERNALAAETAKAQQQIGNQSIDTVNQLKQQVEQQRSNLIGQAQVSSNPGAMAQQAMATASGISAPSAFAPVGNLLNQFGQMYLANRSANAYNGFSNQYLNAQSNPAIFGQYKY